MYYMRSPLTGHLFLLFRGSLTQRGERRLVPATEVHLSSRHERQILNLTAQVRLLFALEHNVPFCPWLHGNWFLWGFLTAQLSLIGRARLNLRLLGAKLGTFATWFLDFCISKAGFSVCAKKRIKHWSFNTIWEDILHLQQSRVDYILLWKTTISPFCMHFINVALFNTTRHMSKGQCCLAQFILPLLTFATPTKGEWSGWVWLLTLLYIQIPHVLLVRGPWLQGLEKALVTRRILPCELQATLHAFNACKKLRKRRTNLKCQNQNIRYHILIR